MYSPAKIKKIFYSHINSITPEAAGKSQGDFTRNRLCNLQDTLMLLITKSGHTLNSEIGEYFTTTGKTRPFASAFVQQRHKLRDDMMPQLFRDLNVLFPFSKTFKGFHLLAIDGSDVNIPALHGDTSALMDHIKGRKGYHQVHLNALYDLLEGRYLDASISPRPVYNERRALCDMIARNTLTGNCLYIGDRGYPSFNVLAIIDHANQFFLFRLSDPDARNSFLKNTALPEDDVFDFDHKFIISRTKSKSKDASVYKYAGKTFDLIPPGDKVTEIKIEFRVVKIKLDTGLFEYIITNLPKKKFPPEVICELYRLRWGIETSFRQIKYNLALTSFHSKRFDFICQEIFAKLIAFNLVALLIKSIKIKQGDTKYVYKIAVSDAIAYCWRFILTKMAGSKLKNLLSRFCKTPIRPGRKYPRNVNSQRAKPLNNRF